MGKGPWKLHWDDKTGTFDKVKPGIKIEDASLPEENRYYWCKRSWCLFAGKADGNSWQKAGQA